MTGTSIRKIVTIVQETRTEIGQKIDPPTRQCAAIAVIANPYAGRYSQELPELEAAGAELGDLLGQKAMAALGIGADEVESFGKAAIVGENGEKEHAAACMHPTMGKPLRAAVGPARRSIARCVTRKTSGRFRISTRWKYPCRTHLARTKSW